MKKDFRIDDDKTFHKLNQDLYKNALTTNRSIQIIMNMFLYNLLISYPEKKDFLNAVDDYLEETKNHVDIIWAQKDEFIKNAGIHFDQIQ